MATLDRRETKTPSPIEVIPTPTELRHAISERSAELTVLRRLLKVAESKARLFPARQGAVHAS